MDIRNRVALVTGGGIRVGRTLTLALASNGARVAIHYNASADGARDVARSIEQAGGQAQTFSADLTKRDTPESLVADVVRAFGQLDILVNSAAVMHRTPFGEVDAAHWDDIVALNLRAPFFLAQAAAPHLRKTKGAILNISDLAAFETWPAYIPHGITKSGLVHMTKSLARVLAPDVRVNAIAPGTVLLPDDWSEKDAEHLKATTPLRREGTPEDVAHAMLFLLAADYVTGETIIVDGGRSVRR